VNFLIPIFRAGYGRHLLLLLGCHQLSKKEKSYRRCECGLVRAKLLYSIAADFSLGALAAAAAA
jgi:hypothetical protein